MVHNCCWSATLLAFLATISNTIAQIVDVGHNGPVYGAHKPSFYGYGGIPAAETAAQLPQLEARQNLGSYDNSYGGQQSDNSYGGGGGGGGSSYGGSSGSSGGYGGYGGGSGIDIVKDFFDDTADASNSTPVLRPPTPVFVRTPWFMPTAFYGHWGGVVYKSPYYFAGIYDPPKQIPNYDAKVAYGDGYGVDAWYASRGQGNFQPISYDTGLNAADGTLTQQANYGGYDGYSVLPGPYALQARDKSSSAAASKLPAEYLKQYSGSSLQQADDAVPAAAADDRSAITGRLANERESGQNIPFEFTAQAPAAPTTAGLAAKYGESSTK